MDEELLKSVLSDFMAQLNVLLSKVKEEAVVESPIDLGKFFSSIKKPLFNGRLTKNQVSGMEAKLKVFLEEGFPVSWAAYALATSYHETARRMQPVREGLSVSDAWRRRNLRYYPWYGRGDVQLTWEDNYKKADAKLGLNGRLVADLDLALDPTISASVMSRGMKEGWFSGDKKGRHTLVRHLPSAVAS
mgnify:CR=1 FL=1